MTAKNLVEPQASEEVGIKIDALAGGISALLTLHPLLVSRTLTRTQIGPRKPAIHSLA